ncbi:hypothetical protein BJV82DRAFT_632418 [Fennellomyces sp. T-0311]|nr:hypothetical protein BJV82DRAFT_632418 [Fennellomyces sp. T-0311]
MPPRRRTIVESDDESAPNKRIRLTDSAEEDISSDEEVDDTPLPADTDGYVEGSIVKITLRNFVTYDYCEFSPGPQLNMIIGPNGTGKSTIVCAIALGLGGTPALLGRAKNIAEFVKTGEDEAMIKIELKRAGGSQNVVIQRNITKSSNASTWRLNGRSAPQKEILSIVNGLNVQVDNLCQFLPQDKVAEFAQLTPPQLLERTQEAAGAHDLLKWHQSLAEWRKVEREMARVYESDADQLKSMQTRNADLERDVIKMRQRAQILKHVELLQAKLPLVKYTDAKKAYERAKEILDEKKAILAQVKRENEPIEEARRQYKEAADIAQAKKAEQNDAQQELRQKLQRITNLYSRSDSEKNKIDREIKSLQRREHERATEIKNKELRIQRAKEALVEEPSQEGIAQLNKDIEDINRQLNDKEFEGQQLVNQNNTLGRRKREIEHELQGKKNEMAAMNNVARRRCETLRKWQADTVAAYTWLKNNREKFSGRIHGPIVLQIDLKDQRYADLVETILGGRHSNHLRAFVCELKEDYHKFTQEVVDAQGLRVTVVWPGIIDRASVKPLMSQEELRSRHNLDYFVSELLEGPRILIDYLCSETKINLVPVGLKNAQERDIADSGKFRRFAFQKNTYEVRTYSYGRGGNQVQVKKIWQSTYLTDQVDNDAMRRLKEEITQLTESLKEVQMEIESLERERSQSKQKLSELHHAREDKRSQKRAIQAQYQKWQKGMMHLQTMEMELQSYKELPDDNEASIQNLKEKLMESAMQRAKYAEQYATVLKEFTKCIIERNVAQLESLQAGAKSDAVEEFAKRQSTAITQAEQGCRQATVDCNHKKSVAQAHMNECRRAGANLPEDLKEEFQEIFNKWRTEDGLDQTANEVEDAIQSEKAKAETLRASDPKAMELYERKLAQIQALTTKMDDDKQKLESLKEKITTTKARWVPRLNFLVSRISESFGEALQKIGCAGEVGVAEDEDFDKWGIEIRVKFRDNEKLQLLTGQRQSGGERAVSTILYLMSLQNLAKSPFRVVDEINQGMDPRNERMIHEQIVKGASKPGTAQYFLITPKLLPDLYYNERMRVLCIYNGEWQPKRLKPLTEYIKNARTTSSSAITSA